MKKPESMFPHVAAGAFLAIGLLVSFAACGGSPDTVVVRDPNSTQPTVVQPGEGETTVVTPTAGGKPDVVKVDEDGDVKKVDADD